MVMWLQIEFMKVVEKTVKQIKKVLWLLIRCVLISTTADQPSHTPWGIMRDRSGHVKGEVQVLIIWKVWTESPWEDKSWRIWNQKPKNKTSEVQKSSKYVGNKIQITCFQYFSYLPDRRGLRGYEYRLLCSVICGIYNKLMCVLIFGFSFHVFKMYFNDS